MFIKDQTNLSFHLQAYLINNSWVFSEDPGVDDPLGEVSVQVDLFTHPGTGEHKVAVKGMDISLLNVILTCDNPSNLHNLPFIVW